ncbi:MAG: hypothetical protein U0353_27490, partial [Sandaracinus sp.]
MSMARAKKHEIEAEEAETAGASADEEGGDEELVLEGTLICALTGEAYKDTPDEQTLQSLIEQLLREYEVDPKDMERDVGLSLE